MLSRHVQVFFDYYITGMKNFSVMKYKGDGFCRPLLNPLSFSQLHNAIGEHCFGDFNKAGDIGAHHVVAFFAVGF